ncbi:MAG: hypothetical protein DRN12_06750 [Thermoplasmata archaeon]|nr:MAG: hypothetical protein DRN12_06750 [Thermoplasmata archaeon]
MGYWIPSDRQVKQILKRVLNKNKVISSQKLLRDLVLRELERIKPNAGLSKERLRRIAANSVFISLEIHAREGKTRKFQTNCPVCNTTLKRIRNQTIWGGVVTLEFRCPLCGYWTGKKRRIPSRYIFHYTP